MFVHQPLVVHPCVSERILPYRSAHDVWLTPKPHKYVRYNTANNVSTFSMSRTILSTMCQTLVATQ